jgi:CspA family cold shock protein
MPLGTVKWFNESKGVGAIRSDSGAEIPVHFSAIRDDGLRTLTQGEEVEFEIRETDRGLQAANVYRH